MKGKVECIAVKEKAELRYLWDRAAGYLSDSPYFSLIPAPPEFSRQQSTADRAVQPIADLWVECQTDLFEKMAAEDIVERGELDCPWNGWLISKSSECY